MNKKYNKHLNDVEAIKMLLNEVFEQHIMLGLANITDTGSSYMLHLNINDDKQVLEFFNHLFDKTPQIIKPIELAIELNRLKNNLDEH